MRPYLNRLSDLLWALARWTEGDLHLLAWDPAAVQGPGATGPAKSPEASTGAGLGRRSQRRGIDVNVEAATAADLPADLVALGVPVFFHADGPQVAVDPGWLSAGSRSPPPSTPDWCTRHGFSGKVGQTVALNARRRPKGAVPT